MPLVRKSDKGIHTSSSANNDTTAASAVTTARATTGNVLFAAECHAPITAPTSNGFDFDAVDEHYSTFKSVEAVSNATLSSGRGGNGNFGCWSNVDATTFTVEVNIAFDQRKQSVILAHSDVATWVPLGSNLTDQDIAREDFFSTELLYATSLCVGVTTVSC
jgi:hypothetical protein